MYARRVTMQLKPNSATLLTEKIVKEILPVLTKQTGFQDHLTFISADGVKAFGISLWDTKESADAYAKNTFPQIEKLLLPMVEGTTHIGGFNVVTSTFHKLPSIGAGVLVAAVAVEVPATVPVTAAETVPATVTA